MMKTDALLENRQTVITAFINFDVAACWFSTVVLNLSWFVPLWPFNWCIINIVTFGFCNITAKLLVKASACGPWRTAPWPSRGAEGPS